MDADKIRPGLLPLEGKLPLFAHQHERRFCFLPAGQATPDENGQQFRIMALLGPQLDQFAAGFHQRRRYFGMARSEKTSVKMATVSIIPRIMRLLANPLPVSEKASQALAAALP